MKRSLTRLLLLLALLAPLALQAENSTAIPGGYKIHHNALPTASLDPAIARQYGIQRSKYRGLLNVSIIKEKAGTTGTPVEAQVSARADNIRGQTIAIPMRRINEGDAIYYIGEYRIVDRETLRFTVEVKPKGSPRFYTATFSQDFYID